MQLHQGLQNLLKTNSYDQLEARQKTVYQSYKPKSALGNRHQVTKQQLRDEFADDEYSQYQKKTQPNKRVIYRSINNGINAQDNISQASSQSKYRVLQNNYATYTADNSKQDIDQQQRQQAQQQTHRYSQFLETSKLSQNQQSQSHQPQMLKKFMSSPEINVKGLKQGTSPALNQKTEQEDTQYQRDEKQSARPKTSNTIYKIRKNKPVELRQQEQSQQQQQQQQQQKESEQNQSKEQAEQQDVIQNEMDPMLFDSVSNNEWAGIIPDEVLLDKNVDLAKYIEDNITYFDSLRDSQSLQKQLALGQSKMDGLALKTRYISGLNTTYARDFYKKATFGKTPYITDKMLETHFGPLRQLDLAYQTQKNDYVQHRLENESRITQKYEPKNIPISKLTSYSQNFINWGDYDITHWKSPVHVSTSNEIPFLGKTTYNDNFSQVSKNQTTKSELFRQQKKGPLPQFTPFQGTTTQMFSFQPFKVQANPSNQVDYSLLDKKQFNPVPSFNGQFTTTMTKDYGPHQIEYKTAKKIKQEFMRDTLQKLEQLREAKLKERASKKQ